MSSFIYGLDCFGAGKLSWPACVSHSFADARHIALGELADHSVCSCAAHCFTQGSYSPPDFDRALGEIDEAFEPEPVDCNIDW